VKKNFTEVNGELDREVLKSDKRNVNSKLKNNQNDRKQQYLDLKPKQKIR